MSKQSAVGERKPYRLTRGHYARREGDLVPRRDPETNAKLGGTTRPFTHYQARTTENPNARNELYLTDKEAEALKGRVMPLFAHDIKTGQEVRHDPEAVTQRKPIDEMITIGMAVSGTKSLNEFREMVLKSGYLAGVRTIPSKKHELVAMLKQVQMKLAHEQAANGAVAD